MASHYNVSPRYTAGSPAMVPERIARMVAAQEPDHCKIALEGYYGDQQQDRARELGLEGIVEYRIETAHGWLVEDLITGKRFMRPFSCDRNCGSRWNASWDTNNDVVHERGCRTNKVNRQTARDRLARFKRTGR